MDNLTNSTDKMVNHPSHYNHGGIETINVIKAWTEDLKGIQASDTANVIKYISRWKSKNGLQDLEKAQWYLTHLINEVKEEELTEQVKEELNREPLVNRVSEETDAGVTNTFFNPINKNREDEEESKEDSDDDFGIRLVASVTNVYFNLHTLSLKCYVFGHPDNYDLISSDGKNFEVIIDSDHYIAVFCGDRLEKEAQKLWKENFNN